MRWILLLCMLCLAVALAAMVQPAGAQDAPADLSQLELAENLILNPGFEEELQDWQKEPAGEDAAFARDNACACEGDWSLALASQTGRGVTCLLYEGPVEPDCRYRFEARYATSSLNAPEETPPAPMAQINFLAGGGPVGPIHYLIASHLAEEWETLTGEFTTPAEADSATVSVAMRGQVGKVWFDEVKFGPLVQDGEPLCYAPDGNVLFNADMELGAKGQPDGWEPGSLRMGIYRQWLKYDKMGSHVWCAEGPHAGEHCLACRVQDPDKVPYIFWAQAVALEPNTTYKLTGWLRTEGETSAKIDACAFAQRGFERESFPTGYVKAGQWRRKSVTFTTPEWDGHCRAGHVAAVGGKVGAFFVDDIRLEKVGGRLEGVSVEVSSEATEHVFQSVKDVKLNLTITNETDEGLKLRAFYVVRKPGTATNPPKALMGPTEVPAGQSVEKELAEFVDEPGIYTLEITVASRRADKLVEKFQFAAMQ